MPIYVYSCPTCQTQFDHLRSMKEADDPAFCPQCTTQAMRQISRFAFKKTVVPNEPGTSKVAHPRACACCSPGRG